MVIYLRSGLKFAWCLVYATELFQTKTCEDRLNIFFELKALKYTYMILFGHTGGGHLCVNWFNI